MKKLIGLVARDLKVCRAERRIERKTAMLVDSWVRRKGFCRDVTLEEASEDIGLSVAQLKFYCSKYLQMPFLSWRKELRIAEAKRLLCRHPDWSQEKVALAVGIRDLRNFRRQFGECAGVPLSEWCAKLRKRKSFVKFVGF